MADFEERIAELNAVALGAEICGQSAIIRMLNLFSNPNYAQIETDDITQTIPFLGK